MKNKWIATLAMILGIVLGLSACAVMDTTGASGADRSARWAVLPFANNTETPLAASRAESITGALLAAKGVANQARYPSALTQETLFDAGAERKQQEEARTWARSQGARYAVVGSVDEWRYKVGVDGEPAVGVTLSIVDLSDDKVIWNGVGAKSGWSREALAAVAQKLIGSLLDQALGSPRN